MDESACFQDRGVGLNAIGEALLILKSQLDDLRDEDERLLAKRLLIHQKMDICIQEISKLYTQLNPTFKHKETPTYPELHLVVD